MNKIKLAILVGTLLAPVALVILLAKSNRKREERFRQWLSPWVALAFVVLCCLFAKTIDNAVGLLLDQPFMQPVKDWIHGGSGLQYGLKLYTAYLVNIGVLTAYLVFKNTYRGFFRLTEKVIRFFIRLIRGKKKKEDKSEETTDPAICLAEQKGLSRLYWEWINLFYSVDDGTFVVREKWLAAGKTCLYAARILGGLYLAFLLFAQLPLLAGFSWYPYGLAGNIIENAYVWPAVSLVLILEFVYFLGGKEEFDRAELIPEEKTEEKPEEANQPDYRPPGRADESADLSAES